MTHKKSRYCKMERYISCALLLDLLMFVLFLIFSGKGVSGGKITFAVLSILISIGVLVFLHITKEILRIRSLWMTAASGAILICVLFSLLLHFPRPKPVYEPQYAKETQGLTGDGEGPKESEQGNFYIPENSLFDFS